MLAGAYLCSHVPRPWVGFPVNWQLLIGGRFGSVNGCVRQPCDWMVTCPAPPQSSSIIVNGYSWWMHGHCVLLMDLTSVIIVLHRFSISLLTFADSLWALNKEPVAAGEIPSALFHTVFLLVKTWCLHYLQCSSATNSSVGDLGVLC